MHNELELPRDSIGCFAEALRLLHPVQRSLERRQMPRAQHPLRPREPHAGSNRSGSSQPSPGSASLPGSSKSVCCSPKPRRPVADARALVEFFDRNVRQRVKGRSTADHPDSGRLNLVTRVQQGLLLFSKALPGGRTREALVEFFDRNFRQRSKGRPAADRTQVRAASTCSPGSSTSSGKPVKPRTAAGHARPHLSSLTAIATRPLTSSGKNPELVCIWPPSGPKSRTPEKPSTGSRTLGRATSIRYSTSPPRSVDRLAARPRSS